MKDRLDRFIDSEKIFLEALRAEYSVHLQKLNQAAPTNTPHDYTARELYHLVLSIAATEALIKRAENFAV